MNKTMDLSSIFDLLFNNKSLNTEQRVVLTKKLSEALETQFAENQCTREIVATIAAKHLIVIIADAISGGNIDFPDTDPTGELEVGGLVADFLKTFAKKKQLRKLILDKLRPYMDKFITSNHFGDKIGIDEMRCSGDMTMDVTNELLEMIYKKRGKRYKEAAEIFIDKLVWAQISKKNRREDTKFRRNGVLVLKLDIENVLKMNTCARQVVAYFVAEKIVDKLEGYLRSEARKQAKGAGIADDLARMILKAAVQSAVEKVISQIPIEVEVAARCVPDLTQYFVDKIMSWINTQKISFGNGDVAPPLPTPQNLVKNVQSIEDLFTKRKPGLLPPPAREKLKEIGGVIITKLRLFRYPIDYEKAIQALTLGAYDKSLQKRGYDHLYHIGMLLNDKYIFHKTDVVELKDGPVPANRNPQFKGLRVPSGIAIAEFIDNTRKEMGDENFSNYNAMNNNCQNFARAALRANGVRPQGESGWFQDVEGAIRDLPKYAPPVVNAITDLGAIVNKMTYGEGLVSLQQHHISRSPHQPYRPIHVSKPRQQYVETWRHLNSLIVV